MARYHAKSFVPYSVEQMFDLVADVESYPKFVPWWIDAKISGVRDGRYCTMQTMGLGPIRLRFSSQTELIRPRRIHVLAKGGGLKHLELTWHFEERENGCMATLDMDMEMSSKALSVVVSRLSKDAARSMMDAFRARARIIFEKDPHMYAQSVRHA